MAVLVRVLPTPKLPTSAVPPSPSVTLCMPTQPPPFAQTPSLTPNLGDQGSLTKTQVRCHLLYEDGPALRGGVQTGWVWFRVRPFSQSTSVIIDGVETVSLTFRSAVRVGTAPRWHSICTASVNGRWMSGWAAGWQNGLEGSWAQWGATCWLAGERDFLVLCTWLQRGDPGHIVSPP